MRTTCILLLLISQLSGLANSLEQQVDQLHERCYENLDNDLESALLLAEKAANLASKTGYIWGEANSLYIKGYIHYIQGDPNKAFVNYLQANYLLKQTNEPDHIDTHVELLLSCGVILFDHYNYQQAISFYQEALKMSAKYTLERKRSQTYYNLGMAYRHLGELNMAAENVFQSLSIAKNLKDDILILNRLNELGLLSSDSQDLIAARQVHQQVLDYNYEKVDSIKYLGRAHHNIAWTYLEEGNYDLATHHYLKALELKEKNNIPEDIFITLLDLTELHLIKGDAESAKKTGLQALDYYDKAGLKPEYFMLFDFLSDAHYQLQEYEEAATSSKRFVHETQRFANQQKEVLQLAEQHKIDQALESFYQKIESKEAVSHLEATVLAIFLAMSAIIAVMFILRMVRKRVLRNTLEREIRKIENSSII